MLAGTSLPLDDASAAGSGLLQLNTLFSNTGLAPGPGLAGAAISAAAPALTAVGGPRRRS